MPLVFIHGVNVRRGESEEDTAKYERFVQFRTQMFNTHLTLWPKARAGLTLLSTELRQAEDFFNPYWGDAGASFKYGLGSLQTSGIERFGSEEEAPAGLAAILSRAKLEKVPSNPNQILPTVANHSMADLLDLLCNYLPLFEPTAPDPQEIARLVLLASAYCDQNRNPVWLKECGDNEEFLDKFEQELLDFARKLAAPKGPQAESFGGGDLSLAVLAEAAKRMATRAVAFAEWPLWKISEKSFRRMMVTFMGDVMTYLDKRGTACKPGEIINIVKDDLLRAQDRARTTNKPLVVVAHSMGGNIAYDLLTYFSPKIDVDLLVTVGSQVGLFEEMSLFRISEEWDRKSKPAKVSKPTNVGVWLNLLDQMDPMAFGMKTGFEGVKDYEHGTSGGVLLSHISYFTEPSLFKRLAIRFNEVNISI